MPMEHANGGVKEFYLKIKYKMDQLGTTSSFSQGIHNPHWNFLYQIAHEFPRRPNYEETQNYREFFEAIQYVIPSPSYRVYFAQYLRTRPIDASLDRQETLVGWVLDLHPGLDLPSSNIPLGRYLQSMIDYYPPSPSFQEILLYKNFFLILQKVLPPGVPRQERLHRPSHGGLNRLIYTHGLRQYPVDPYLISRVALQQWAQLMRLST